MILSPATAVSVPPALRAAPAARPFSAASILYWAAAGALAIAVLDAAPPDIRLMVPMPAPAGPIAVITWLPTTATAAQAAMPAAHRRQWGKRTALPFWAGAGLLVCSWDFGVSGCMASRRAFSSSGA